VGGGNEADGGRYGGAAWIFGLDGEQVTASGPGEDFTKTVATVGERALVDLMAGVAGLQGGGHGFAGLRGGQGVLEFVQSYKDAHNRIFLKKSCVQHPASGVRRPVFTRIRHGINKPNLPGLETSSCTVGTVIEHYPGKLLCRLPGWRFNPGAALTSLFHNGSYGLVCLFHDGA
jgi:hypothetical protein